MLAVFLEHLDDPSGGVKRLVCGVGDAGKEEVEPTFPTAVFADLLEQSIVFDLAPKFYPVLSSLQRFLVAVVGSVAAGCGAEPFRLRSTASRR
uniref:hypothetical protein n=1 Tax=Rhizobium laguerreae TaxID=1076926 RepID=UPI001FE28024